MTVFELGGEIDRRRRRSRLPARRASRRRPRAARLLLPSRPRRFARSCSRTGTRITSAPCPTCCASSRSPGRGDAAHARARQVEARRARRRPAAELREVDPTAGPSSSAPSGSSSCAWRTRSPTPSRSWSRRLRGRVLHTGDWKLDHTPVDGLKTDVGTLAEIGNRGVDLLLGDSTNAERPGMTGSERLVGEAFRQIIPHARAGRILVATFASNIHRMQQAADVARRLRAEGRASSAARCART